MAEFTAPLRVRPGRNVTPGKDFDPGFEAGIENKWDGVERRFGLALASAVLLVIRWEAGRFVARRPEA